MATRESDRRRPPAAAEGAAPRDPALVTPEMIRAGEERLGRMEVFERSEHWQDQRTVLEARSTALRAQRDGLLRKLGREPVALEALARLEGQIEENERLVRFPAVTKSLWTEQLAQMRAALIRQRAGA